MANTTIPQSESPSASRSTRTTDTLARDIVAAQLSRERLEEEGRKRAATLDAPWYNEKLDPFNFGREDLDPQHIAIFNGTEGGRRHASFPERTLDTGLGFNPIRSPLTVADPSERSASALPPGQLPEIVTEIITELWTPSTSNGALGQSLAVATDAPPSIAGPPDPPLTVSPPIDPDNPPELPDEQIIAPEGSLRAARREQREEAGAGTSRPAVTTKRDTAQREAAERERASREKK